MINIRPEYSKKYLFNLNIENPNNDLCILS